MTVPMVLNVPKVHNSTAHQFLILRYEKVVKSTLAAVLSGQLMTKLPDGLGLLVGDHLYCSALRLIPKSRQN